MGADGKGSRAVAEKYLDQEASNRDLVERMPREDREAWIKFGHLRIEPAFQDRVFVAYRAEGKGHDQRQLPPTILGQIRVLSFVARDESGCTVRLLNETDNTTQEVSHIPQRIFNLPIFMAVPASFTLKWDAHVRNAQVERSLSYLLFIKARNKAEFFSRGNVYLETPKKFKALYSHLDLKLDL